MGDPTVLKKPHSAGMPGIGGAQQRAKIVKDTIAIELWEKFDGFQVLAKADEHRNVNEFVFPKSEKQLPVDAEVHAILVYEFRDCEHDVYLELICVNKTMEHQFHGVCGLPNLKTPLTKADWNTRGLRLVAHQYAHGEDASKRTYAPQTLFAGKITRTEKGEKEFSIDPQSGEPHMVVTDTAMHCNKHTLEQEIDSLLKAALHQDAAPVEGWMMHLVFARGDSRNELQTQEDGLYYNPSLFKIKSVESRMATCTGLFKFFSPTGKLVCPPSMCRPLCASETGATRK